MIAVDANYAEAYAALGNVYFFIGVNGVEETKEVMRKAKISAEQPLKVNETTDRKYVSPVELSMIYLGLGDTDKALTKLEQG